jgi:hypothetical protein
MPAGEYSQKEFARFPFLFIDLGLLFPNWELSNPLKVVMCLSLWTRSAVVSSGLEAVASFRVHPADTLKTRVLQVFPLGVKQKK